MCTGTLALWLIHQTLQRGAVPFIVLPLVLHCLVALSVRKDGISLIVTTWKTPRFHTVWQQADQAFLLFTHATNPSEFRTPPVSKAVDVGMHVGRIQTSALNSFYGTLYLCVLCLWCFFFF